MDFIFSQESCKIIKGSTKTRKEDEQKEEAKR